MLHPHALVIDPDSFARAGVATCLRAEGFYVVEAVEAESGWQLALQYQPAIVVLEAVLPLAPNQYAIYERSLGIELAARLKRAHPTVGIVIFSAYPDRRDKIAELIGNFPGGVAYKIKGHSPQHLQNAIRAVQAGRVDIDAATINSKTLDTLLRQTLTAEENRYAEQALTNFAQLSERYKQVALLTAASHNLKGIAQALSLTENTVSNYKREIYEILGLDEITVRTAAPHLNREVLLAKICLLYQLQTYSEPLTKEWVSLA